MQIRFPAILAVLLLAVATSAFADLWYENYQKGEDALRSKNWTEAIAQLTQALEKKGDPGVGVRTYGMNFINYHPYLKLGIAYLNLGQADAALQAFDTEEKLGAITRSPRDMKELATFREQARSAQGARKAGEQKKVADLVAKGIDDARALEEKGDLEGAMAALGKAISVDGTNPAVTSAMKRLQDKIAAAQNTRSIQDQSAGYLREGRSLLAAGKYQEASSTLIQALSLKPDDAEMKGLLEESQARLKAQIQATQDQVSRRKLVADGLVESAGLEKAGQLEQALQRLQLVLAVEPENRQALGMQARLAKAQADAEGKASLETQVAALLQEGETLFKEKALDRSLTVFLRALALDPQNTAAQSFVTRVSVEISRSLLGESTAPRITLNDFRNGKDRAGIPRQMVSSPDFVLSGTVFHTQPVTVTFLDGKDRVVQEAALDRIKFGNFYLNPFQQTFRLDPGETTLKVLVRDPAGLSAREEYRVDYSRPLTQSPWFYSGLALLALSAAGGFVGYRVRRRRLLLKRRFNPYVAGAPVLDAEMFLGREGLLSRILQTIHNNSILLYGERRIGKTSLQHHLKKRLLQIKDPDFDFYPVYIDLQGTPQERFFATLAEDIFHDLRPILDSSSASRGNPADAGYDYSSFVRDTHDVLKILRKQSQKKVKLVLLIDEVDELNNYDPRINQRLRSLFMKSFAEDLVAVVSGVAIKKHWASEGSPWYNFFEEIEVKPFARKDAEDLIERPIRGIFKLEQGAVDRIIEHTNCKPYLIQKLCVALVNRMHDQRRSRITVADVDAIGRPLEG